MARRRMSRMMTSDTRLHEVTPVFAISSCHYFLDTNAHNEGQRNFSVDVQGMVGLIVSICEPLVISRTCSCCLMIKPLASDVTITHIQFALNVNKLLTYYINPQWVHHAVYLISEIRSHSMSVEFEFDRVSINVRYLIFPRLLRIKPHISIEEAFIQGTLYTPRILSRIPPELVVIPEPILSFITQPYRGGIPVNLEHIALEGKTVTPAQRAFHEGILAALEFIGKEAIEDWGLLEQGSEEWAQGEDLINDLLDAFEISALRDMSCPQAKEWRIGGTGWSLRDEPCLFDLV
jgi:hypothetical protein